MYSAVDEVILTAELNSVSFNLVEPLTHCYEYLKTLRTMGFTHLGAGIFVQFVYCFVTKLDRVLWKKTRHDIIPGFKELHIERQVN